MSCVSTVLITTGAQEVMVACPSWFVCCAVQVVVSERRENECAGGVCMCVYVCVLCVCKRRRINL